MNTKQMSQDSTEPTAPPPESEVVRAFALLERYLPAIVYEIEERCDEKFAHGFAFGVCAALGAERGEAVLASLRGEAPGTAVRRHVRCRDMKAVRKNLDQLRTRE